MPTHCAEALPFHCFVSSTSCRPPPLNDGLEVFCRYVAKNLMRQIMRSPAVGVGGQRREVTVMFSDIEGFSRISENIAPKLLTSGYRDTSMR